MTAQRPAVHDSALSMTMATDYVLGHSETEPQRLMWQAEVLRPYTERLLRLAGIGPGMRSVAAGGRRHRSFRDRLWTEVAVSARLGT